jgi:hypothetical protein
MLRTTPRLRLCLAALAIFVACGTAEGAIRVDRIQKSDVKVLPGAGGFLNPLSGTVSYTPQDWQNRRALGIKVGNSSPERPQAGLDRADVVYEEIVEGGVTRFLAVFLTNQAPRVGPVRSVRTADPLIMQPMKGLFGYSGGVPPVIEQLRNTDGVTDVGANVVGNAFTRDPNRNQPYNLYTATDRLWSGRDGEPSPPQFEFLKSDEDRATGGEQDAKEIRLSFAGNGDNLKYVWDAEAGVYERYIGDSAHLVEGPDDGTHLGFTNLLIQMVGISAGTTTDTRGNPTSDIELVGDGGAALFRGGKAIRGRWERGSAGEPTRFIANAGGAIKLAPGTTIVELLPDSRADTLMVS